MTGRSAHRLHHLLPDLLDPGHPERLAMAECGFDRIVLAVLDGVDGFLADEASPQG
ncbi:MAG: hypothetical protein R2697_21250 [Ilumatobacteraceae bacterium]